MAHISVPRSATMIVSAEFGEHVVALYVTTTGVYHLALNGCTVSTTAMVSKAERLCGYIFRGAGGSIYHDCKCPVELESAWDEKAEADAVYVNLDASHLIPEYSTGCTLKDKMIAYAIEARKGGSAPAMTGKAQAEESKAEAMTIKTDAQLFAAIRALGYVVRKTDGEYRIASRASEVGAEKAEAGAYYTDDREDAYNTAKAMAAAYQAGLRGEPLVTQDQAEAVEEAVSAPRAIVTDGTTQGERDMLRNIIENEMTGLNGKAPESFEQYESQAGSTWSDCLQDQGPVPMTGKTVSGLVGSLVKKGLAWSDGEGVGATEAGFAVWQAGR